jgi:uncharacterized membrane protein YhdT
MSSNWNNMLTKILNWLNETNGYTRGGAPRPNWFVLACFLFVFIFFIVEINIIRKKRKKRKRKIRNT